ncbi:MAG TPA: DUF2141 domain-containing protein [Rhizomicrobium sp.]|nr:DUF2141 domain-containing protein [Rhizomicrobium sp.]
MLRAFLAAALALAFAPGASAAPASATLIIKVQKVSPRGGDIRVALYTEANYGGENGQPVRDAVVPAKPGETIVTLSDVGPGVYAVKLFQDFNRNGIFDMSWYGLPLEKFGFSNDARPTFTEPPFAATRFELRPGTNTITIRLQ